MEMKQRERILLSAYACEPDKGSEPGVGWNWATHLAEQYEVYVITRSNNKDVIERYLAKNPIDHLHFYYHDCSSTVRKLKKLPNGIFLYYKRWQKEILPLAESIVKQEKIQLVHHITFNEFRTPGKLYKLNVPFVWGPIGGGQFYCEEYREAFFTRKDIIKELLRNLINNAYIHGSRDIKMAVNCASVILIADQSTEKIMPKSRSYVRLLETAYNSNRNGIKESYNKQTERMKLLWVGGIWPRKGLKLLLDALGNCSFRDFELNIIGDGEDKSKCINLVKKYGLERQIHFWGKMSYQDVNQYYDAADIFLFTSLRDTSGNVLLEAMSHGLPVITLDHHGAGEIVTDETGTKIAVKSYGQMQKDIIDAIMKYKNDPNLIERQGRAGRRRIESVYSWENNISVMSSVYDQIIGDVKNDI